MWKDFLNICLARVPISTVAVATQRLIRNDACNSLTFELELRTNKIQYEDPKNLHILQLASAMQYLCYAWEIKAQDIPEATLIAPPNTKSSSKLHGRSILHQDESLFFSPPPLSIHSLSQCHMRSEAFPPSFDPDLCFLFDAACNLRPDAGTANAGCICCTLNETKGRSCS